MLPQASVADRGAASDLARSKKARSDLAEVRDRFPAPGARLDPALSADKSVWRGLREGRHDDDVAFFYFS